VKANRSLIVLGLIAVAILAAAIVARGARPAPDTADLPTVAIEPQ
jgi:hypothetical protein